MRSFPRSHWRHECFDGLARIVPIFHDFLLIKNLKTYIPPPSTGARAEVFDHPHHPYFLALSLTASSPVQTGDSTPEFRSHSVVLSGNSESKDSVGRSQKHPSLRAV